MRFETLTPADWRNVQLVYVCSPGNPTGHVMTLDEWKQLFELSDRHGFVIAADECYSEIYFEEGNPPLGQSGSGVTAWPRPLRKTRDVLQPVEAIERSGNALRLRGGRRRCTRKVFAVPHLSRHCDERRRATRKHRRLAAMKGTWSKTGACTRRSSSRRRRSSPPAYRVRYRTRRFTYGRARRSATPSMRSGCMRTNT